MRKILLVNGHQPFPSSPGRLNAAFIERARQAFLAGGAAVESVAVADAWDVETQIGLQLWADFVLYQFPLNSMGPPWTLKRYLDEVFTAGMDGRLARGDGRTRSDPSRAYGSGGRMQVRSYALSLTMNAPRDAFDDPDAPLFQGRSVDELLAPLHINFAFFGLERRPGFVAHDVAKNPTVEADMARFETYLSGLLAR
ncbi:NAD(P)H-dependent oxidoreductase [Maricaulis maris]|uniref:NAD(P)H-dependent oxidoreductase n=1 Tax=Maricaulis maris TaxID=74318 RepID=UPI0026ED520F|nr:NAD(P)H-dependent oxidoreductase [Maricaulis maris]